MANELNLRINFTHTKNNAIAQRNIQALFNVTGNAVVQSVQSIATTDTTLVLGDVSTIGFFYFHNLDPINYIIIGSDGTLYPNKVKPGEFGMVRWNAAAIHAKANAAACLLEYILIPD